MSCDRFRVRICPLLLKPLGPEVHDSCRRRSSLLSFSTRDLSTVHLARQLRGHVTKSQPSALRLVRWTGFDEVRFSTRSLQEISSAHLARQLRGYVVFERQTTTTAPQQPLTNNATTTACAQRPNSTNPTGEFCGWRHDREVGVGGSPGSGPRAG